MPGKSIIDLNLTKSIYIILQIQFPTIGKIVFLHSTCRIMHARGIDNLKTFIGRFFFVRAFGVSTFCLTGGSFGGGFGGFGGGMGGGSGGGGASGGW